MTGGGGGGTTVVEAPKPSEEELALQRKQTEILEQQLQIIKQQSEQEKLISPILFKQIGLEPTLDETGKITGFTEIPDPNKPIREDIESQFLNRTQKALAGELPVAPQLLRDLNQTEDTLRETLRKQLGSGFETSTPGIEALSKFSEQKESLLENARRDDLTLAEQLGVARGIANDDVLARFLSQATGLNNNPLNLANQFGQSASGFGQQLGFFQNQRNQQFQADIFNAQNASKGRSGGLLNSIFGGVAQGIGSGAGTAIGTKIFSSKKMKTKNATVEIDKILGAVKYIPVEQWEYKTEPGVQHIGPYAEDFQRLFGKGDGTSIPIVDALGVLFAAVKALTLRVEELQHVES